MSALLDIRAIRTCAPDALEDVSLQARAGEVTALLGANGAGKTTLLSAIIGQTPLAAGAIVFDGRDLAGLPSRRRARRGIGYCPSGRRVFPGMSVEDNLDAGCFASASERARLKREAMDLFPQLAAHRRLAAWRLSGGQQQMLAIARALMAKPRLLLLDEPSLGLAPALVDELLVKLRGVAEAGAAVLLAEQNIGAALAVADRAIILTRGRVATQGDAAGMRQAADLSRIVMGL